MGLSHRIHAARLRFQSSADPQPQVDKLHDLPGILCNESIVLSDLLGVFGDPSACLRPVLGEE